VRRQRAEQLREALVRASRVRLIRPLAGGAPGYLRLPILVDGGLDGVANAPLAQRLGAARSYPRPLGELPAVQPRLAGTAAQWPGAVELARTLVTLPTHSLLSARHMDLLARAVAG